MQQTHTEEQIELIEGILSNPELGYELFRSLHTYNTKMTPSERKELMRIEKKLNKMVG